MEKKIELKRHPRWQGADDENCIWHLKVNGYVIGSYYCGRKKLYEDKYKWAEEMINARIPVILRNIKRLSGELKEWKRELDSLK